MWQRPLTKIHFWVQSEQDQKTKRQIGYQWDNSLIFLKNKYRRRANLWNRQRIPDFRPSVKDTELLLPRTQTSLSRAQRKAGRRHRARRLVCTLPMVPCGSSPVARLYLAKKEAHEEEAGIALYLFYKNEVYSEELVEFRIDGLDYYLRTSHESY